MVLDGSSRALAWFDNGNMMNAYMYGIDCNNPTYYLLVMMDRVRLCYTQMEAGDSVKYFV